MKWGSLDNKKRQRVIKTAIAYCKDNDLPIPEKIEKGVFFACIFWDVEYSGWISRAVRKYIAAERKEQVCI